jgi:hypothetical protein
MTGDFFPGVSDLDLLVTMAPNADESPPSWTGSTVQPTSCSLSSTRAAGIDWRPSALIAFCDHPQTVPLPRMLVPSPLARAPSGAGRSLLDQRD